uniref:Uncharacterized protein n=1 Tax=Arundo donax TaxID=35708 RepID=A0A0A9DQB8_ARUDO
MANWLHTGNGNLYLTSKNVQNPHCQNKGTVFCFFKKNINQWQFD